jgi:hypothetical protein
MIVDRYTKAVLSVIAVALVVIAARPWLSESGLLGAVRPQAALAQGVVPKFEVTVPKDWGKLVGFSSGNLLLEGADHSLRIVDVEGRSPEYPKIKALIHWQ